MKNNDQPSLYVRMQPVIPEKQLSGPAKKQTSFYPYLKAILTETLKPFSGGKVISMFNGESNNNLSIS
ncbi:MAG: hypothetical protein WBC06_13195 [Chitinophagaceae bacterium]